MKKKTNTTDEITLSEAMVVSNQLEQDTKNAILIISLLINAFILIGWITLQITSLYDSQIAAFLFTR